MAEDHVSLAIERAKQTLEGQPEREDFDAFLVRAAELLVHMTGTHPITGKMTLDRQVSFEQALNKVRAVLAPQRGGAPNAT